MTAPNDTERLVRTFLEDGPTELRDGRYDAVRAGIDGTRQRVVIGPWRTTDVLTFGKLAAAVAAIVIVAVAGIGLFGGTALVGTGPSPTAAPTPTPSPTPAPIETSAPPPSPDPTATDQTGGLPADGTLLVAGEYAFAGSSGERSLKLTFTAATGWVSRGWYITSPDGLPGQAALALWEWDPEQGAITAVYDDLCLADPSGAAIDGTVGAFTTAFMAQGSRTVDPPTDVAVGPYEGAQLDSVVDDESLTCRGATLATWALNGGVARQLRAGATQRILVLDIDGTRLVLEGSWDAGTPANVVADLAAMMDPSAIQISLE